MPIEDRSIGSEGERYLESLKPAQKMKRIKTQVDVITHKYQSQQSKGPVSATIYSERVVSPYWVADETQRLVKSGALEDPESFREDIDYLDQQYGELRPRLADSHNLNAASSSEERYKLNSQIRRIQNDLEGSSGLPVYKRLPRFMTDFALKKEKERLQQRLDELYYEMDQDYQKGSDLSQKVDLQYKNIKDRQEENRRTSLEDDMGQVRDGYVEVVRDVMKDGVILDQTRKVYIKQNIIPELEKLVATKVLTGDEVADFLQKFPEMLAKKDQTENQEKWKEEITFFVSSNDIIGGNLSSLCQPLIEGQDKEMMESFFYMDAVDKLQTIRDAAASDPQLADLARVTFHGILTNVVMWCQDDGFINESMVYQNPAEFLSSKYGNNLTYQEIERNIKLLRAMKDSPLLEDLIGEKITFYDNEVVKILQNWSLTDKQGEYIHALTNYPNPDSIRNLVLLVAADYQNYRTVNANGALTTLAKRPDWPQLLEAAIEKYPQLEAMHRILQNWDYTQQSNNPVIADLATNFAFNIAEKAGGDGYLRALALQACPNSKVLEVLVGNNLITEQERQSIESAQALVEQDNNQLVGDARGISNDFYTATYRARAILSGAVTNNPKELRELHSLATISQAVVDNPEDQAYRNFLTSSHILSILQQDISEENLQNLLNLPRIIPASQIENLIHYVCEYPKVLLTDQALNLTAQVVEKLEDERHLKDVMSKVGSGVISIENAKLLVDVGKVFFGEKMDGVRNLVLQSGNTLIKDPEDVKFLVGLVGRFGGRATEVIKSYRDCLETSVVTLNDKGVVLELVQQFRMPTPEIMKKYKMAKESGTERLFLSELKALASRITSGEILSDEERSKPFFNDLIQRVYPNNVGSWTTYASNASCGERNSDLSEFVIRPKYEIDLMAAGKISLKEGVKLDRPNIDRLTNNVLSVAKKFAEMDYDPEKMQGEVLVRIDTLLNGIVQQGGLKGISVESLSTVDEKLFLLMTEAEYGTSKVSKSELKDLMISYEFAYFEDVRDYIQGTTDRVSKAGNADYALLCELDNFYSDRVKEVGRRIVGAGWGNPEISKKMPEYFADLVEISQKQRRQETINRFQIDKLGLSDGFIKQISRQLKERTGKEYSSKQVREILVRYESITNGLNSKRDLNRDRIDAFKASNPDKKRTKEEITQAVYGQFKFQRDKTINAARAISGAELDPQSIHIGEINLQQMLDTQMSIIEGIYDDEQFASYTGQRFVDLFIDERQILEKELGKFISETGNERTILNAFITKSKESANARMVGGVCVSGDNPDKNPSQNMWDMENYFQLVLQDPDTFQCQGLVLLHDFSEDGKRILTASLNPSSTYLYSVDEKAMLVGILGALEQFAGDNNFDEIVLSQNKGIRTNRTGGVFEDAINERIAQVGTKRVFTNEKVFSYRPSYTLKDMDVVWQKGA